MKPVSLAEVKEYIGDLEEKPELKDYLKKFSNLTKEKITNFLLVDLK